jgi:hypothetical protein
LSGSGTIGSPMGPSGKAPGTGSARAHGALCPAKLRQSRSAHPHFDLSIAERPSCRASGLAAAVLESLEGQAKVPTGTKPTAHPGQFSDRRSREQGRQAAAGTFL